MDPHLKVLLVEDQPEAAKLVACTLATAPGTPVQLQWEDNLAHAFQELKRDQYDAVLLDLNLPDSAGFATFLKMREQAPEAPIIILTADEDESMAVSAVRAGAEDYLIKRDLPRDLLPRRIRYAIERHRARRKGNKPEGRILCFVGVKGGCGTTTLTLNLASVLAASEKSAVAVELSASPGGLAAQLQITPRAHLGLLGEIAPGGITRRAVEQCLVQLPFGFHGLLASPESDDPRQLDPRSAETLLGILASLYEYVLVDLPATLTDTSVSVMQCATLVMPVVERSHVGLRCGRRRVAALRAAGIQGKSIAAVVVNKTPLLEFPPPADMADQLGCGIIAIIPPAAADSSGVPLAHLHADLPFTDLFTDAIRELGRELSTDPVPFQNP